ncbi:MAG: hypothetical protein R2824_29090 [Saprospiraceae bacterium]|nr:hypothetical protein [Lewinella sp.]
MYRLDRTAFRRHTAEEADNQVAYWLKQPLAERLRAATYLIRTAWNIGPDDDWSLDRSLFKIRHRSMSNNIFHADFQDFIKALNQNEVKYILVGGYAVILHGYSRTTGDMDVWVKPDRENYQRLVRAFADFGMPMFDLTAEKFLKTKHYDVYTYGKPPVAIDLMTAVKGMDFDEAFAGATWHEFEDLSIRVIRYQDLLKAKQSTGRMRDLNDIEQLEKGRKK